MPLSNIIFKVDIKIQPGSSRDPRIGGSSDLDRTNFRNLDVDANRSMVGPVQDQHTGIFLKLGPMRTYRASSGSLFAAFLSKRIRNQAYDCCDYRLIHRVWQSLDKTLMAKFWNFGHRLGQSLSGTNFGHACPSNSDHHLANFECAILFLFGFIKTIC